MLTATIENVLNRGLPRFAARAAALCPTLTGDGAWPSKVREIHTR